MKLPNVVGGGAAKCGTTSLYNYLLGHPEVFLPRERKEIAFFSPSVASGLETFDDYKALYAAAMPQRHKAVLDISTSYLYDAQAPELIRRHLGPEVKIIVFLRNPAHMAFSLWLHMVKDGSEKLSFTEALACEGERMQDDDFKRACADWHCNYYYRSRARYAGQIERYVALFGKANVKVHVFESSSRRVCDSGRPFFPISASTTAMTRPTPTGSTIPEARRGPISPPASSTVSRR